MAPKLPVKFLLERYEKDEQFFRVYDDYRPDYYKSAITRKFYARHDQANLDDADPEILRRTILVRDKGPREKFPWPVTGNQEYGWFLSQFAEVDYTDKRFHHPRIGSEITKFNLFAKKRK